MKKIFVLFAVLCLSLPAFATNSALKLSLWDNIAFAIPANNIYNVSGIDLGIGSKTDSVTGAQIDLIWAQTNYQLNGASFAWLVNMANKVSGFQTAAFVKASDVRGVQLGAANLAYAFTGAQVGAVNLASVANGAQIGFYNQADTLVSGFQIGLLNYARSITQGLQFGLLNIAENGFVPVMVFVNGRF